MAKILDIQPVSLDVQPVELDIQPLEPLDIQPVQDVQVPRDLPKPRHITTPRDIRIGKIDLGVGPLTIGPASARNIRDLKKRLPLPPNATGEEILDRALHIVADPVLRTTYKIMTGRLLEAPEVAWAAIKKILPPDMQAGLEGKTLEQSIDLALGYDPSAFVEFIGELGEFVGGLQTAGKILGPMGTPVGAQQRAAAEALRFGVAAAGQEASKAAAGSIDFDTEYGYIGASNVVVNLGLGAGFSYLGTAGSAVKHRVAGTVFGRAIEKATHSVAVDLAKRFPLVMDSIRKNPEAHFTKQVIKAVKAETGISLRNMTKVQKAAIKHVAREGSRAYRLARADYLRNTPANVIIANRKSIPKQITGGVAPEASLVARVGELTEQSVVVGDKLVGGELVKGFEGTLTGDFTVNNQGNRIATVVDSLGESHQVPVQDILIPEEAGEQAITEGTISKISEDVAVAETAISEGEKVTKTEMNKLKSQVHKTQREMKIGDSQYSQIAFETTGKRSAADMTKGELTDFDNALKATHPSVNFVTESRITMSNDTGSRLISPDSNVAKEQEIHRRIQIRNVNKTNAQVRDAKSKGKEKSMITWWAPKRLAVAKFEDTTSVPVTLLDYQTTKAAKLRSHRSREEFAKLLAGMPADAQISPKEAKKLIKNVENLIGSTSIESNEQIAKWLFSPEGRTEVEPFMSSQDIQTANTLNDMLQNSVIAQERMQEALRLWIDRGKAPSDISKFDAAQKKNIFDQAKEAQSNGNLSGYTQQLFESDIRFGLREYYYPAEGDHTDAVLDMLKTATSSPIADVRSTEAEPPSLIGGETRARRGIGTPRKGSVFANIMNSYERVSVRNEVAENLKELYSRYNSVELSSQDKKYLDGVYSEMLLKGELSTPPHTILQKLHATFWRTHLSLVTNFAGATKATIRNSLQFLEAGGATNVRALARTGFDIANSLARGGGLEAIDSEMAADFHNSFDGYISQRGSQYRDSMFIDLDRKARADNLAARSVELTKLMLDKTGFAYVGVDTVSRAAMWPTVYKTVKDAATRYQNNEITYEKYLSITNIDTMMSRSQTNVARELLSAGDIRGLSNYIADTYTFDIFRAYSTEERAGIERTRKQRTITGIYTYPRGVFDLFYSRGIRPLFSKDSTNGQRRRGAANVAKGLLGRTAANTILVGLGLGSMYALGRTFYTPLQPSLNIVSTTMGRMSLIMFQHSQGELDTETAIKALAEVLYEGADDIVHVLPDIKKTDDTGERKERSARSTREERK